MRSAVVPLFAVAALLAGPGCVAPGSDPDPDAGLPPPDSGSPPPDADLPPPDADLPAGPWDLTIHTYDAVRGIPREAAPALLAVRDGDSSSPWQPLTPSDAPITVQLTHPSGRYSVVTGCAATGAVTIVHATVLDGLELHLPACTNNEVGPESSSGGPISGHDCATVRAGYATLLLTCDHPEWLIPVASGRYDILATSGMSHTSTPERLFIERDVLFPAGLNHTIDFDGPLGADTEWRFVAVPAGAFANVNYVTRYGSTWLGSAATGVYGGVPVALQDPAETHAFCASWPSGGGTASSCRRFKQAVDLAVTDTDGAAPVAVTATSSTTPYLRVSWDVGAGLGEAIGVRATFTAGLAPGWAIVASRAWLGAATTLDTDDLSSLPGWSSAYELSGPATWSFTAVEQGAPASTPPATIVEVANAATFPLSARDGLSYSTFATGGP